MSKKVDKKTPMEIVTAGYEDFMRRQKEKFGSKKKFDNIIKKATKPKPRGSK